MLSYLRITHFALIEDVELTFGPAMNAITGETGAGKSMILQAVSLLRGERASTDWIRSGCEEARIEAVFQLGANELSTKQVLTQLQEAGFSTDCILEEGLVVSRMLSAKGRHRASLAGQLAPVSLLAQVCGGLMDVSSQHEHQTLLDAGKHLQVLDRSGVSAALRDRMQAAWKRLQEAHVALKEEQQNEINRAQREDFLRFQLDELMDVQLQEGEEERLRHEQKQVRSFERLQQAAERGEEILYHQENALVVQLEQLRKAWVEASAIEPKFQGWSQQIQEAAVILDDVARQLQRYLASAQAQPGRLQEIEERLYVLGKVLRKHGPDIVTALQNQRKLQAEWDALQQVEVRIKQAQKEVDLARAEAATVAEELTQTRVQVAKQLIQQANISLHALAMPHAQLAFVVSARLGKESDEPAFLFPNPSAGLCKMTADGWDRCELLFSPNPGEAARPLHRIASGGELSRILLALKKTIGQADGISTCIFDEVDAGIGGSVADAVGRQLRSLSHKKQVLCITHLAQIAAYAQDHVCVEKQVDVGRTVTQVRVLSAKDRAEELARMMGGAQITPKTRAHAKELLAGASQAV